MRKLQHEILDFTQEHVWQGRRLLRGAAPAHRGRRGLRARRPAIGARRGALRVPRSGYHNIMMSLYHISYCRLLNNKFRHYKSYLIMIKYIYYRLHRQPQLHLRQEGRQSGVADRVRRQGIPHGWENVCMILTSGGVSLIARTHSTVHAG